MAVGNVATMIWGGSSSGGSSSAGLPASTPIGSTLSPTDTAPITPTTGGNGLLSSGPSPDFQAGLPTGFTQRDLGGGRYDILDTSGQSVGTGYKSVRDAIGELGLSNAQQKTVQTDDGYWTNDYLSVAKSLWNSVDDSGTVTDGTQPFGLSFDQAKQIEQLKVVDREARADTTPFRFKSQDELNALLSRNYASAADYGGVMGDWEALGQVLGGSVTPFSGMASMTDEGNFGNLPSNNQDETITGTGILYGSTPVFSADGKLIGYRTDLSPNTDSQWSNGTDRIVNSGLGTQITHNGKAHTWSNAAWRDLGSADTWGQNALVAADGSAFIPLENVGNLGWTNKDSSAHQDNPWGDTGKIGSIVLGAVGSFIAGPAGGAAGSALGSYLGSMADGYEKDAAVKNAVVSGVSSYLGSGLATGSWGTEGGIATGSAGNAAGSASGAATGTAAGTAAGTASKGVFDGLSNYLIGDVAKVAIGKTTVGAIVDSAVARSVASAVMAGVTGKDLNEVASAAFASAISSLVGNATGASVADATGSGLAGKVAGSVASSAAGTLVNQATGNQPASSTSPASPVTPATGSVPSYAGSVTRMIWR